MHVPCIFLDGIAIRLAGVITNWEIFEHAPEVVASRSKSQQGVGGGVPQRVNMG
jgi:hypothetical protein